MAKFLTVGKDSRAVVNIDHISWYEIVDIEDGHALKIHIAGETRHYVDFVMHYPTIESIHSEVIKAINSHAIIYVIDPEYKDNPDYKEEETK